ncbi:MAG: hypothetical protein KGM98_02070 [Bacteroidota bacterium]|nr:hypothetical protein [Bacteroidota bacterium]
MVSQILQDANGGQEIQNPFHNFSSRGLEITRHLIRRASNKEICAVLNPRVSMVAAYKAPILDKPGCSSIMDVHEMAGVPEFN